VLQRPDGLVSAAGGGHALLFHVCVCVRVGELQQRSFYQPAMVSQRSQRPSGAQQKDGTIDTMYYSTSSRGNLPADPTCSEQTRNVHNAGFHVMQGRARLVTAGRWAPQRVRWRPAARGSVSLPAAAGYAL
jgi:hypothetical protein